jgi:hypothetical protein
MLSAGELGRAVDHHLHQVTAFLTGAARPRLARRWGVSREIGVQHLTLVRSVAMMFGRRWRLAWDSYPGRYVVYWHRRRSAASYDRNLDWLEGVRATVAATAS